VKYFPSKESLRDKILAFVAKHNRQPKPFRWRKRDVKETWSAAQGSRI